MQAIWNGNAQTIAQTYTLTVTAIAAGGTLSATISNKTITYTCTGSDTTATAAAAWQQLLASSSAPPEIQELTFSVAGSVITATMQTAGTPTTLTVAATGGAAVTLVQTVANSSPSDVFNAQNWLRGGFAGLPQAGDDLVLANSSVPLLWNLDKLAALRPNSVTRYQSFTGTVGLPDWNPDDYWEWRPKSLQLLGPLGGILPILLGYGTGDGPTRERYDVQGQQTNLTLLASGAPADDFAVTFLGSNPLNTLRVTQSSLGVAMTPGDTAALASAFVDSGSTLALGAGVSYGGLTSSKGGVSSSAVANQGVVTCFAGTLYLYSAPGSVILDQGALGYLLAQGTTFQSLLADSSSQYRHLCNSAITSLTLQSGSILDKSSDVQLASIGTATIDPDCQILDPNNCLTWTGAITLGGALTSGPLVVGRGRKVQLQ